MIGIIIIILILLHIIYLNTKYLEKFGGMAQCKSLKNPGSNVVSIMNKVNGCISGITGEIDGALDKIENISDTINGLIEDKLNDLIPIGKITEIFSSFENPKKTFYDPMSILWWQITGMESSKAAEKKAREEEEKERARVAAEKKAREDEERARVAAEKKAKDDEERARVAAEKKAKNDTKGNEKGKEKGKENEKKKEKEKEKEKEKKVTNRSQPSPLQECERKCKTLSSRRIIKCIRKCRKKYR